MQTRASDATLQYITKTFVNEPEVFQAARVAGEALRPGMQVSPYEGHLLAWLLQASGASRALEIGSFVGYSTLWQARALPDAGMLLSLEYNETHAALTAKHLAQAGLAEKAQVQQADALAYLQQYTGAPFGYVFIDAVKKDYPAYLQAVLPHLTPNAWVVADNALLFGAFTNDTPYERVSKMAKQAMGDFHHYLAQSDAFEAVMLPTPEGLLLAKRRG